MTDLKDDWEFNETLNAEDYNQLVERVNAIHYDGWRKAVVGADHSFNLTANAATEIADGMTTTFLGPTSGKVLVTISVLVDTGTPADVALIAHHTLGDVGTNVLTAEIAAGRQRVEGLMVISGLTPKAEYSVTARIVSSSSDTQVVVNSTAMSPAVMVVEPVV